MAELPSGAVTFLFTDIEGSTRLLKQLRERYADVLAEHQRLLRAAFAAHGGHEIDTQGDSFFVAFAHPRDALLAAVEGQLAIVAHPWPDGVQVKVRMGLHTGQAVASGGRYTGLAVHRAARIGAAGHGGQVLVSQATQTLLEDEEEDLHVFLRDLGEQHLKDLDRPVRLYQADADGLPGSFPPLRQEAGLAHAAEAAIEAPRPLYRRPLALVAAALVAAAVIAGVVIATRSGGGGLGGVEPNHVGIIDPQTNEIVAEVPVGVRPGAVATGAGSVWVGNLEERTLSRIDPRSPTKARTITLDNRATPTGVAVGAGGVWVAHGYLGTLSRIDPEFPQEADTVPVTGPSDAGAVAVGDGSVWAIYGDATLARIDPQAVRRVGTGSAGSNPTGIVYWRNAVWVANGGEATVRRFEPETFREGHVEEFTVGAGPAGIAAGANAIWVANAGSDTVTRIDPQSAASDTIRVGDEPAGIVVAAGAVWVANGGAGTISRIDPSTYEVTATIETGNRPTGLAAGFGYVWVTVQPS